MAIKRWNASTSTWELVGTPGTATPAAIGAAALVGGNTFTSTQRINGRLAIQSTGDRQVDLIGQDGNTYAYIGTTGGIGSAPANSLKIRSDAGGIIFGYQGFEQARIDTSGNMGIGTAAPTTKFHVETSGANYITSRNSAAGAGIAGFICQNSGDTRGMHINGSTLHLYDYSAGASRIAIDSSGNVGIGTSSPQTNARLHAYTSSGAWNPYVFENVNAGGMASVWFKNDGTSTSGQGAVVGLGGSSTGFANYSKRLNIVSYANASTGTGSTGITISMEGASDGNQDFRIVTGAGSSASVMVPQVNGYLLVGYTSSQGAYRLQVNSQIFATSSSIATSDGRYKENVLPITSGLDIIDSLNPVSFDWKEHAVHNFPEGKTVGFIAQEVQEALSDYEWVDNIIKSNYNEEADEEFLGIAESNIIPLLVAAVKELRSELNTLKASML